MKTDCHIHVRGTEDGKKVLAEMDRKGFGRLVLFGPPRETMKKQKEADDLLAKICAPDPKRLLAFPWIDPRIRGIAGEIKRCAGKLGCAGFKMIPDHWCPCDKFMFPVYRTIEALGKPIIFHSGILWGNEDSSRFCRPANYEVVIHFPKLTIALAHISWPWTDECIAVSNRFKFIARDTKRSVPQVLIDTTRGTPPVYRKDALAKAVACCGVENLLFGSDGSHAEDLTMSLEHQRLDTEILAAIGCTREQIEGYCGSNLDRLFKTS